MLSLRKFGFVYLLLWCAYNVQGFLFPIGGFLSQSIFVLISLFNVYCFIQCLIINNKSVYFRGLTPMVIICLLYVLAYIGSSSLLFKNIVCSVLPIFSFYYLFYKDALSVRDLENWSVIFLLVLLIVYRLHQLDYLEQDLTENVSEMTNNAGMRMITIIPIVLLIKRPILKYMVLGVSLLFTILAMKRGAILIAVILLMIFLFFSSKANSKKKIRTLLIGAGIIVGLFFVVKNLLQNNAYFIWRLENTLEGDDSGRRNMWDYAIDVYNNNYSIMEKLLGRGPNGFSSLAGTGAHNDWYEFLLDFGVFGVIFYAFYWLCFVLSWKNAKKILGKSEITIVLTMVIISLFIRTLFSFSFLNMFFLDTCLLGFCLANVSKVNKLS